VFSDREVTQEIKLAFLHLKDRLIAIVAFSCSAILIPLGLLLFGVADTHLHIARAVYSCRKCRVEVL
jgi:hypothetical protein